MAVTNLVLNRIFKTVTEYFSRAPDIEWLCTLMSVRLNTNQCTYIHTNGGKRTYVKITRRCFKQSKLFH